MNLLQVSLLQLITFVSGVPAGRLGDDLLAILVSTNGHIPIFPSKMHSPAAAYRGRAIAHKNITLIK
jgi:hypothetical protein